MATTVLTTNPQDDCILGTWSNLGAAETGDKMDVGQYPFKSFQVSGAFTTVDLQGSNDGTNWAACHIQSTGAIAQLAAPGILQIAETCRFVRPVPVGGAGFVVAVFAMRSAQ